MCAIIGAVLEKPSDEDLILLKRVILESSIRGLHATGMTVVKNGRLHTRKDSLPAAEFLATVDFFDLLNEDGNLYMVAHCRYSTSDLEYNQPMMNNDISIVHNGVITQELPENWKKLYGFDCQTKNDSELLLKTVESGQNPLLKWSEASISACEIRSDKTFRFYRNGKRPLQMKTVGSGVIVASTKDIFVRSGIDNSIDSEMNVVYTLRDGIMSAVSVPTNNKDLQYGKYEI